MNSQIGGRDPRTWSPRRIHPRIVQMLRDVVPDYRVGSRRYARVEYGIDIPAADELLRGITMITGQ
jgi:hypothetical protein